MPVTESAKKKVRRDKRRTVINREIRLQIKSTVKEMRQKPAKKAFQKASRALDLAAKKGIIHKKKASRSKSRLAKLLPKSKKKTPKKTS
ncbi:MAG TPA: 30S ribosomal protein S20 [Patescibacteria group bacterium]|nr:30S ribosomal protein S20 [Patescibacteria group bacterium]